MRYDNILFDLDGTLTDPKIGITSCVRHALARMGIQEAEEARLLPYIGPPLAYGFRTFHHIAEERIPAAIAAYRERFVTHGMFENEVYAGINELLASLRENGGRLYVATSKMEAYAERILEHFDLLRHFDGVAGSLPDGTRSEKGEVIAHLRHMFGLDPARTVMIGDTAYDACGARENGMDVIAVSYGYGDWAATVAEGPTATADSVAALRLLLLSRE